MLTTRVQLLIIICFEAVYCEPTESQKNLENIIETQQEYCLNTPTCNLPINIRRRKRDISSVNLIWKNQTSLKETNCCETCSCTSYTCFGDGNCCPGVFNTYEQFISASESQDLSCVPLQLKPRSTVNDNKTYPNTINSVIMWKKCPERYKDYGEGSPRRKRDDLLQKCEDEDVDDILTKIPVTLKQSKQTFKNKYCAECAGFEEWSLDYWDVQIACNGSVLKPMNMDDFLPMVLEAEECNIFFYSQDLLQELDSCDVPISTCNVTGKWLSYDPVIETACGAYSASYLNIYKNIFCFMCNENEMKEQSEECVDEKITIDKTDLSFALVTKYAEIVKFGYENVSKNDNDGEPCQGNTLFDPLQQSCIEIFCQYPKIYRNGSCANFASKIGGVGYRVFLQLTPVSKILIDVTEGKINSFFREWLDTNGLGVYLHAYSVHTKREYASQSAAYLVIYFEFFLPPEEPGDISLIESVHDMHGRVMQFNCCGEMNEPQEFNVRLEYFDMFRNSANNVFIMKWDITSSRSFTLDTYVCTENDFEQYMLKKNNIIYLLPTYACPLLTLHSDFYGVHQYPWGVSLDRSSTKLGKAEFIAQNSMNGSTDISVCKDTFDMIQKMALENIAPCGHDISIVVQICGATYSLQAFFAL